MKNGALITLVYLFLALVNQNGAQADQNSSDLPPPPTKPEKFTSKQQLKDYLVKLHEYYAIIGRPRFGRSFNMEDAQLEQPKQQQQQQAEGEENGQESNENMAYLIPNAFKSSENSISLIFELLDSDKDGLITKSEFLKFFRSLGQQN